MRLTAPIFRLKRQARSLSRDAGIPLHDALDRIAIGEGFDSWSLLAARHMSARPETRLLNKLVPGDLLLLGARPGQGKTQLALQLIVEAVASGRIGYFFTFEFTRTDLEDRLVAMGMNRTDLGDAVSVDTSELISADYVIDRLSEAPAGTLAVIDYLQLLDQKRDKPPLSDQVASLKAFAQATGIIVVFISQIDRSFDPTAKPVPDTRDIRLPNPVDLSLFSKMCFLHDGQLSLRTAGDERAT